VVHAKDHSEEIKIHHYYSLSVVVDVFVLKNRRVSWSEFGMGETYYLRVVDWYPIQIIQGKKNIMNSHSFEYSDFDVMNAFAV
jgi:hypothetical protein